LDAAMGDFLTNPMWLGIGGLVGLAALVVPIILHFIGRTKVNFGEISRLSSYFKTSKDNFELRHFASFYFAHNIAVKFNCALTDVNISGAGVFVFEDIPSIDIRDDEAGRAVVYMAQLRKIQGVILKTCSEKDSDILTITLDNGHAFRQQYYVKIQSYLAIYSTFMAGLLVRLMFVGLVVSLLLGSIINLLSRPGVVIK
jgi:hypothetical protein